MLHTLLLNFTYECISFITEKKVFKLLAKDRIEVLSSWEEESVWASGKIKHPAVIRLKYLVRWIPRKVKFNRIGVFRRDSFNCQYCTVQLSPSKLTMDHVLPKNQGGDSSWRNCVAACFTCNNRKGNRTPEQAGMKLLKRPAVPLITIASEYHLLNNKHEDWKTYLNLE